MNTSGILNIVYIFGILVFLISLYTYQLRWTVPIVRQRIEATWPMYPGFSEGFANKTMEQWLPSPEVLTKPTVGDCPGTLHNAASYSKDTKNPYNSYDLLDGGKQEPRIALGPTSQQCYETDWSRQLEVGGSYAQRTNNYKKYYPDSCSAPNHDLILDFYKPKLM